MKILNLIVQKIATFSFILSFVFVSLYSPLPFNKTNNSDAWFASEATQVLNNLELVIVNASTAVSAIADKLLSSKELFLDGIGWALAKQVVSAMTASIVDWINSGFEGSPAFVQDLEGFLLNVADDTAGLYLEHLGGDLSFLCSPFKLDVQIAVATAYQKERDGYLAGSCTLTGAVDNIKNFVAGDFSSGGWGSWFEITSSPETNTPYGSVLNAKAELDLKIKNARGQEIEVLNWGTGFLSKKECTDSEYGPPACKIVSPGEVIASSLNKHLGAGVDGLVAADEINEIIGALIGQLAQQVITGAGGLLGVSSASADGGSGSSYLDQLINENSNASSSIIGDISNKITESIADEGRYKQAAEAYKPQLESVSNNPLYPNEKRELARREVQKIGILLIDIGNNLFELNNLLQRSQNATGAELTVITNEYFALSLHSDTEIDGAIRIWEAILDEPETDPSTTPPGS